MSSDRAIHAVPSGPDLTSHRASSQCPCHPVVCGDLEQPSRLVFLHQRQTEPAPIRHDATNWPIR
jgi:hypothetical protein